MVSEVYRKVGRGGAGNIYSPQDLKNIEESLKDIEGQKPVDVIDPASIEQRQSEYAHQGRGGAGNWYLPADVPKPQVTDPADVNEPSASKPSYSGRGGAGNYNPGNEEARQADMAKETEGKQKKEVVQDVEQDLRPPEKAHLGEGRAPLREMH